MKTKKKSNFRTIAESLAFDGLKEFNVATPNLDHRKLSVDEIKTMIREEFEKAKKSSDTKSKEIEHGWGAADVENQVKWSKVLKLKEFFKKGGDE